MKITIDTKEDSHEDIQKVLHILVNILEKKGISSITSGYSPSSYSSSSASQTATDTAPLMSLFDDAPPASASPTKDVAPDFSSFLNLTKPMEKKEAMPRVEIF